LGARGRTIEYVTGLPHGEIKRLFFGGHAPAPRGRAPTSPDWYHYANLLSRTEASIFVSIYRRIRGLGFGPAEALVSGYKHYLQVCSGCPRINFDRSFDFASHVDGLWLVRTPNLSLLACSICGSEYVTSLSAYSVANECPFCKLLKRYARDARIRQSFRMKALPDISKMELNVMALWKRAPTLRMSGASALA
jgi:hypothetical protein